MRGISISSAYLKVKRNFSLTALVCSILPQEKTPVQDPLEKQRSVRIPHPAPADLLASIPPPPTSCSWTSHPSHSGKFREDLPPTDDGEFENPRSAPAPPKRYNTEPARPTYRKPWYQMTDEELHEEYEECRARAPHVTPNFLWCNRRDSLDENAMLASMGLKRAKTFSGPIIYCYPETGEYLVRNGKEVGIPLHADEAEALVRGDIVDLTAPGIAGKLRKAEPQAGPSMPRSSIAPPPLARRRLKVHPDPYPIERYRSSLLQDVTEVSSDIEEIKKSYRALIRGYDDDTDQSSIKSSLQSQTPQRASLLGLAAA
ncbi:hypothetical protein F5Y11DRAFT_363746 [Daldinia sp. FL1419]|nr:hypothetical protein F5Y11DRAFT_363746 [Daldinia sp. FL1419]